MWSLATIESTPSTLITSILTIQGKGGLGPMPSRSNTPSPALTVRYMPRRSKAWTMAFCHAGRRMAPVGITSTPVNDPSSHITYLVARFAPQPRHADSGSKAYYFHISPELECRNLGVGRRVGGRSGAPIDLCVHGQQW